MNLLIYILIGLGVEVLRRFFAWTLRGPNTMPPQGGEFYTIILWPLVLPIMLVAYVLCFRRKKRDSRKLAKVDAALASSKAKVRFTPEGGFEVYMVYTEEPKHADNHSGNSGVYSPQ